MYLGLTTTYAYLEASAPVVEGDTAWFLGPILPVITSSQPKCFQFDYNMYGAGMGELNIYFIDKSSSTKNKHWSANGNKRKQWRHGKVPVPVGSNLQVCNSCIFILY